MNSRIMVLENKTLLGRFITQVLSQYEYEVTSVSTVEETEARLGQRVDCLVVYAPRGVSAWNEQIDAWRKLAPSMKIIVVSDNFSDKRAGAAQEPDGQVGIPFEPEKLVQTVEKVPGEAGSSAKPEARAGRHRIGSHRRVLAGPLSSEVGAGTRGYGPGGYHLGRVVWSRQLACR